MDLIALMIFCHSIQRECIVIDDVSPREAVIEAANYHEFPHDIALAVATAESNMNCNAKSRVGARGIMQVMPKTAEYIGYDPDQLFDCEHGAMAGVKYLSMQYERCNKNLECLLTSYNCGPSCRNPKNTETVNYIRKINHLIEKSNDQ